MSVPQDAAFDAIACQLIAALERYEQDSGRMIAAWPDLEAYGEASDTIERIRMYAGALPEVRVQWVELLIAHADLVHSLWRVQYRGEGEVASGLAQLRDHHSDCVAALRQRCLRILARQRPSA